MQKRNLGKSMKVSSVGLGCMGITHASGTPLTIWTMQRSHRTSTTNLK